MAEDVVDFIAANAADLIAYAETIHTTDGDTPWAWAGHDFALTRNGHGAGFWDRGLGDLGDRLADAARVYGEASLWPDEVGKLYAE